MSRSRAGQRAGFPSVQAGLTAQQHGDCDENHSRAVFRSGSAQSCPLHECQRNCTVQRGQRWERLTSQGREEEDDLGLDDGQQTSVRVPWRRLRL
jgi:hypothetical protein